MIKIRSRKDGFRRCGLSHSSQWVEHPDDRFSEEELEILKNEPMLQVEIVRPPEKKPKKDN